MLGITKTKELVRWLVFGRLELDDKARHIFLCFAFGSETQDCTFRYLEHQVVSRITINNWHSQPFGW